MAFGVRIGATPGVRRSFRCHPWVVAFDSVPPSAVGGRLGATLAFRVRFGVTLCFWRSCRRHACFSSSFWRHLGFRRSSWRHHWFPVSVLVQPVVFGVCFCCHPFAFSVRVGVALDCWCSRWCRPWRSALVLVSLSVFGIRIGATLICGRSRRCQPWCSAFVVVSPLGFGVRFVVIFGVRHMCGATRGFRCTFASS